VGRISVSPISHRKHHAKARRLQNPNFSMLSAFWDDLFGTADRVSPAPKEHGLVGDPVPESWLGQLAHPFREILKDLRKRMRPPDAVAVPPVGPAEGPSFRPDCGRSSAGSQPPAAGRPG